MWWQKSLNNGGESFTEQQNNQGIKPTEDGSFDLERILSELCEGKEDIRPSDVLYFPEPLRSTLNFAVRNGRTSLVEFANMMKLDISRARQLSNLLVTKNLLRLSLSSTDKEPIYETRISARTHSPGCSTRDIWGKLDG